MRGEFTPGYLFFEEVPNRIFEELGSEVKILIMLRQPIKRALSHYKMLYNYGKETSTFQELFENAKINGIDNSIQSNNPSYFERGLYSKPIMRYLELFNHVKIIFFEDFIQENDEVMKEIYDFLDIEYYKLDLKESNKEKNIKYKKLFGFLHKSYHMSPFLQHFIRGNLAANLKKVIKKGISNKNNIVINLDKEFIEELEQYYYDDICELERITGRNLDDWKKYY